MCNMIHDIQRAHDVLYIQCYRLYSPTERDTMSMDSTARAACVSEWGSGDIKHSAIDVSKKDAGPFSQGRWAYRQPGEAVSDEHGPLVDFNCTEDHQMALFTDVVVWSLFVSLSVTTEHVHITELHYKCIGQRFKYLSFYPDHHKVPLPTTQTSKKP